VRKRLFGILVLVIVPILGFGLGILAAAAGTARAATPERAAHVSGVRIAATAQFLTTLKNAREAGRDVALGTEIPDIPNPVNVCIPQLTTGNPTQCMNDWNGTLANGPVFRFYHYGNSNGFNAVYVLNVGTIRQVSGGFQPFTDGSGLNARYNGNNVYEFEWSRNGTSQNACIAGYGPNANSVNAPCDITGSHTVLWFVLTDYNGYVSVGASNALYGRTHTANQPVWVGSNGKGNISNGDNVYLTTTQGNELAWASYFDGG